MLIVYFFSRKATMKAHPDKGGTEAKMAAVNEAYEVLSNPGTYPTLGKGKRKNPLGI
jgi:curved DNA-binding protein CbpA